MAENPLMQGGWIGGPPPPDLHAYAAKLNSMRFSANLGYFWFVNTRHEPDGSKLEFLDRRDSLPPPAKWLPQPGEVEAIQANVARCIANGMTQAEFNAMVDRQRG